MKELLREFYASCDALQLSYCFISLKFISCPQGPQAPRGHLLTLSWISLHSSKMKVS